MAAERGKGHGSKRSDVTSFLARKGFLFADDLDLGQVIRRCRDARFHFCSPWLVLLHTLHTLTDTGGGGGQLDKQFRRPFRLAETKPPVVHKKKKKPQWSGSSPEHAPVFPRCLPWIPSSIWRRGGRSHNQPPELTCQGVRGLAHAVSRGAGFWLTEMHGGAGRR